jgi:hypothetical protein
MCTWRVAFGHPSPTWPWRMNEFKAKAGTKLQAFSFATGEVETIHLIWSADRKDGAIQWGKNLMVTHGPQGVHYHGYCR